uniref:Uncharacterized protein n=1 Tax=Rangifer tarandus platyrhynchus TaxID=3082113 RepID=A0ACB0ETE6_RANTA|nr:unnamed protein product [Rangifer tarandus platyrhynchus]
MARVSVKPAPGKAGLAGTGHFSRREEKAVLPQALTLRLSRRGVLGSGHGEPLGQTLKAGSRTTLQPTRRAAGPQPSGRSRPPPAAPASSPHTGASALTR